MGPFGETKTIGRRAKDYAGWQIGSAQDVAWIVTQSGLTIESGIPLIFDDYATLELPARSVTELAEHEHDQALLAVLENHATSRSWWLDYLESGGSDVVFPDAPRVEIYQGGWEYVLVMAGPEQARRWREHESWQRWKNTFLPDLMFPDDHGWLFSTLWDDDWSCIGGSSELVLELLADPVLAARTRRVTVDQDATPPGHVAW